ncbi:MAG: septum formation inhibitor Maf [Burkholderiales bacterium]|nr:MAG: septum formation inhibitor Maf [Burkholderiales bacterium]CAG1009110.1 7-methyl-GTP pyrophosphatase [Myxococcaceae bacterium]
MPRLILASTSPYRRALLERLGLPFAVRAPQIEEAPQSGEAPDQTARRLAESKARAVAQEFPLGLVIGSDQVAELDGTPINKPITHAKALAQLQAMRGREVVFHSALAVLDAATGWLQVDSVPTRVVFRELPDADLDRYLRLEQPYDCAGSAKVEGLGIALLARVDSTDPTALIGLPLIRLTEMLRTAGLDPLAATT